MSLDFIGGIFQANAQEHAANVNAQNVRDTNTQNLLLSIMARGGALSAAEAQRLGVPDLAGKSSAILPYYLADIEKATGTNAGQLALALQKAAPTVGDYSAIIQPYLAQTAQSRALSENLLSGDMTKQMLSEAQPVEAARLDVAQTQKNAALEQLEKTLNEIDAIQARKGYSGDSFGNRLLKFQARAGIMSGAAGNIALAKLANAQEEQGIKNTGRQMQLSNLTLPETLASGEIALKRSPVSAASSTAQDAMGPLSPFSIGPHAFQQQNLPLVDLTSKTGLALSGLAANGNSALNYGLNKYFQSLNSGGGMTESGDLSNSFGSNPNDFQGFSGEGGGGGTIDPSVSAGSDVPAPAFGGG